MMKRRFHLVAVTADLTRTLVIQTTAGWLLPWLDDDPRAELPEQVDAALSRMATASELIHEAPLMPEHAGPSQVSSGAGAPGTPGTPGTSGASGTSASSVADGSRRSPASRVGRTSSPSSSPSSPVQGSCVALVSEPLRSRDVVAVPHATLLSTPALIPLQRQAWLQAVSRLQQPVAPFDSGPQVAATLDWARHCAAARADAHVRTVVRHRCTRHEYVVRLETTAGRMYLKAGPDRATDEGVLTERLARLSPGQFPETVALDTAGHRWLYRELAGDLLIGSRLTKDTAAAAVRALAAVQKRALTAPDVEAHLAARRCDAVGLFTRADALVVSAWTSVADGWLDEWARARDAIASACEDLDRLALPLTLVLSDFWPRNVLTTPNGIGFIDLEHSYWSCPWLPLDRFLREVERVLGTGAAGAASADAAPSLARPASRNAVRTGIEDAFVEEWADVVGRHAMARGLAYLPLLGGLFGILLVSREADLREQGLGAPLPEGDRARQLVPRLRGLLDEARRLQGRTRRIAVGRERPDLHVPKA